ncbi:hypothetical protein BMETH_80911162188, partial [methanotrophic bacterial endosymbiont of Bathymodiolus sp.]
VGAMFGVGMGIGNSGSATSYVPTKNDLELTVGFFTAL